MDIEDLTPEQRERLHNGCGYELAKLISTILLAIIFLFALPFLGSLATTVTLILQCLGSLVIAQLVVNWLIYPENPLEDLREELRKNNDLP